MKPGYVVETKQFFNGDNCIILSNYHITNKVINYPWKLTSFIKEEKSVTDVGVWKLKNLKK